MFISCHMLMRCGPRKCLRVSEPKSVAHPFMIWKARSALAPWVGSKVLVLFLYLKLDPEMVFQLKGNC